MKPGNFSYYFFWPPCSGAGWSAPMAVGFIERGWRATEPRPGWSPGRGVYELRHFHVQQTHQPARPPSRLVALRSRPRRAVEMWTLTWPVSGHERRCLRTAMVLDDHIAVGRGYIIRRRHRYNARLLATACKHTDATHHRTHHNENASRQASLSWRPHRLPGQSAPAAAACAISISAAMWLSFSWPVSCKDLSMNMPTLLPSSSSARTDTPN